MMSNRSATDGRRSLTYWLRRTDVWAVTTNEPALAARIRAELR